MGSTGDRLYLDVNSEFKFIFLGVIFIYRKEKILSGYLFFLINNIYWIGIVIVKYFMDAMKDALFIYMHIHVKDFSGDIFWGFFWNFLTRRVLLFLRIRASSDTVLDRLHPSPDVQLCTMSQTNWREGEESLGKFFLVIIEQ